MPVAPTTLVFSSGGIRGLAHVGAIQVLGSVGWVGNNVRTIVGTSAGAIMGMLLALRYTPDEIVHLARKWDYSTLSEFGIYPSRLLSLHRTLGLVNSAQSPLCKFIQTVVQNSRVARGDKDLTLGTLHQRTGTELVVCATDTWTSLPVYFGPMTHPDMAVATAVRASCNIPFYFTPVDGRYVDGALVDHYPFSWTNAPVGRIIGVVIVDEDTEDDDEFETPKSTPRPANSIWDYVRRLVRSVESNGTRRFLSSADVEERSIVVRCARGVGAYSRREEYLDAGVRAARAFVARQRALKSTARIGPTARNDITRVLRIHNNLTRKDVIKK